MTRRRAPVLFIRVAESLCGMAMRPIGENAEKVGATSGSARPWHRGWRHEA